MIFTDPNKKTRKGRCGDTTLLPILSAKALLSKLKRKWWLEQIKELVQLPESHYQRLYETVINNFAEFVQTIPSDIDGKLGSLLSEGLCRGYLVLRQLLDTHVQDADAERAKTDPRFVYGLFTSALLLDINKVFDYYRAIISNKEGYAISEWLPYKGSMVGLGPYYKLYPYGGSATRLHRYTTVLLARQVIPEEGFNWLMEDRRLANLWFSMLGEEDTGKGGFGLYYRLIKDEYEKIRLQKGLFITETLELHPSPKTKAGEEFLKWLKEGIKNGKITVNKEDSKVFIVPGGAFIAIDLFRDFVSAYSTYRDYVVVYKQFNHLGLTRLSGNDYKVNQYFSEAPGSRPHISSLLKEHFLGHTAAPAKSENKRLNHIPEYVASPSKARTKEGTRTVAKEGVLVKDPLYIFHETEIPSLARNAIAVFSRGYYEALLPKLNARIGPHPQSDLE